MVHNVNKIIRKYGDKGSEPDTWNYLKESGNSKLSATFTCPNGHLMVLIDCTIDDDGLVHPDIKCPEKGCDFHEQIKLEGWDPNHKDIGGEPNGDE